MKKKYRSGFIRDPTKIPQVYLMKKFGTYGVFKVENKKATMIHKPFKTKKSAIDYAIKRADSWMEFVPYE